MLQKVLGRRNAAILLTCGRLPFAVCASAGLVVSAGFVFNEVFVGLLILTAAGLFSPSDTQNTTEMNVSFDYRHMTAAASVLIGFDMGLYVSRDVNIKFSKLFSAIVM
jgi:hypothetical protein